MAKLSFYEDIGLDLLYLSIDFLLRRLILSVLLCRAFSAVVGVLSNRCRGFALNVLRLLGKVLGAPRGLESADAVLELILQRFWASPRAVWARSWAACRGPKATLGSLGAFLKQPGANLKQSRDTLDEL